MLSIGKLRAGQETYYENSVAAGREDYFSGSGESQGRWFGKGAARLQLTLQDPDPDLPLYALRPSGLVAPGQLNTVISGDDPGTGSKVRTGPEPKYAAFDLTYSAPKSISVLHALGTPEIKRAIVGCHEEAVTASLRYLEDTAAYVRRGRGSTETQPAEMVVGMFRHRVSRAQDPQLHTHCVAANMARGTDGKWTALHSAVLYRAAQTGGYLYQAHLRHLVHERLGLQWGPVRKGVAELECIPATVRDEFSTRKKQIEALAEELGIEMGGPSKANHAVRESRARKEPFDRKEWELRVHERAAAAGLDRFALAEILDGCYRALERAGVSVDYPVPERTAERLASDAGLTEKHTSFDKRTVLREFCQAAAQGAHVEELRGMAQGFTERDDVLALAGRKNEWTTTGMVAVEAQLIDDAVSRAGEGVGIVDDRCLRRGILGMGLNLDQHAAVERATSSGNGVDVIQARAGSGKTWTAGALRRVYEEAHMPVIGVGATGRAARELESEAGIESKTLTAQVMALERGEALPPRAVVILDEAGMCGTRETAKLMKACRESGAKVIAIGDPGQLHSVQAGGWMRAVGDRIGSMKLSEVHRQRDMQERRALGALHAGAAPLFVEWAQKTGRVELDGSVQAAVGDWAQASAEVGLSEAVLITRSNATRAVLNDQARKMVRERGHLGPDETYGEITLATGDRIICRRNDRMLDVVNGTLGTVVEAGAWGVRIETAGGAKRELPRDYAQEHVEHAYALTAHGCQGATFERAFVVCEPHELTRGWSYTALSRTRAETRLYILAGLADRDREEFAPGEIREKPTEKELVASVTRYLQTPDAELVAIDRLPDHGLELVR